jgi:hypothetical protein
VWLTIYFTFGIGVARKKMQFLFNQNIDSSAFHPLEIANQGLELSKIGSVVTLIAPTIFLLVRLGAKSSKPSMARVKRKWGDGTFAAYSTLLPYIFLAAIKLQNPWKALTFVMSGDGRNHVQYVEAIRATSHTTLSIGNIGVPVLGNAIGALISAANGATGLLDVRDIWGLNSVYVFSAGILVATASILLTTYFGENKFFNYIILIIPMVLLSIFVSSSGVITFKILYDGFFSLYFGMSLLALVICFFFTVIDSRKWSIGLLLILTVWSLMASYTYLAPAGAMIAMVYLFFLWRGVPKSKLKLFGSFSIFAFILVLTMIFGGRFIEEFKYRAEMSGSVYPTDGVLLFTACLVGIVVVILGTGELKKLFSAVLLIVATTALLLVYGESLPANKGSSYSYYSSKLIIGITGALFILIPLIISLIFRSTSWKMMFKPKLGIKKFLVITAVSALPIALLHTMNTNLPVYVIRRGWINPDPGSIQQVINDWDSGPKLYFQYAQDDEKYDYPSAAADRMLNFWSPLFWDASGEYSQFHTWAYVGQTSSDPAILCDIIKSKQIVVVTRNKDMPNLVQNSCGPTETKFKIYK